MGRDESGISDGSLLEFLIAVTILRKDGRLLFVHSGLDLIHRCLLHSKKYDSRSREV